MTTYAASDFSDSDLELADAMIDAAAEKQAVDGVEATGWIERKAQKLEVLGEDAGKIIASVKYLIAKRTK